MNHKKAQEGLMRLDLRYEESIKWSCWTPWIHHKTGPLLWPLQVFPAGTLLLQVFPLACFASEVSLASFCRSLLCKFPIGFKWSLQPDKPHVLPPCMLVLVKARDYKMRRPHPLHEPLEGTGKTNEAWLEIWGAYKMTNLYPLDTP